MPVARPESSDSRVIAHIDMDCFYVQVEQRKQPQLRGQPTAVVQYNEWKGGALIAVSYEARGYGVKRSMRGDEAKQVCPGIQLVQVPVARGKADLAAYRNAGSEVVSILARKGRCQRASIDEVYLDLTEAAQTMLAHTPPASLESINEEALKSHVLGLEVDASNFRESVRSWLIRSDADHRDKLLACGAIIVSELRLQVLKQTEFTCSAGVAHNKMLAKLASGMNKPAQQTVVPFSSVKQLLDPLPIKKMKQLGGKLGTSLQSELHVNTVGDLLKFSEEKLQECCGTNTGTWLWNIARGIDGEEVQGRLLPKSHGAGKTFPGPRALRTIAAVKNWIKELCAELSDRLHSDLEENKRIAHTFTLHATAFKVIHSDAVKKFPSKSCSLRYGVAKIQEDAFLLFQAGLREYLGPCKFKTSGNQRQSWGITGLSVSASKIVAIPSGTRTIMNYYHNSSFSRETSNENVTQESLLLAPSDGFCCHSGRHLSAGGSDSNILEPEIESNAEERKECTMTASHQEDDKEMWREKEKSSILRFFHKHNPCFSKHELVKIAQEGKSSSSSDFCANSGFLVNSCSKTMKDEFPQDTCHADTVHKMGTNSLGQYENSSTWTYKIDEIDPAVLNELPLEIQDEVRSWLRPQKRANIVRKGSSITNYFLPSQKS